MVKKIILDLCGGTAAWSKPYKDEGYDVRLITLPDNNVLTYEPPESVYGILAAPPCTMFSLARTTAKTPRDLDAGMEIVRACLKIIWKVKPKFWVLENPQGLLRRFLGKPAMTFHPCEFGDPYMKKTDLWGYFNEPKRNLIKLTNEQVARAKINNRTLSELPKDYVLPEKEKKQSARRAITPAGFARAFFESNK